MALQSDHRPSVMARQHFHTTSRRQAIPFLGLAGLLKVCASTLRSGRWQSVKRTCTEGYAQGGMFSGWAYVEDASINCQCTLSEVLLAGAHSICLRALYDKALICITSLGVYDP